MPRLGLGRGLGSALTLVPAIATTAATTPHINITAISLLRVLKSHDAISFESTASSNFAPALILGRSFGFTIQPAIKPDLPVLPNNEFP